MGEGGGAVKFLTFTSANGNTPQTVTVTAVDDLDVEGNEGTSIVYTVSSTDSAFDDGWMTPRTTAVTVLDNECGPWGYNVMDFNQNCYVDLGDFAIFVVEWLKCTDPSGTGCENLN